MHRDTRPPHSAASDVLAGRLRTGEKMIAATDDLNERARLEMHWLRLLKDYERAVDADRRQAEGQVPA